MDVRLELHDHHTWRVQAIAWYVEDAQSLSSKHPLLFTTLRGRAARVVTAKLSMEQMLSNGGFQALLAVLNRAYGGDSADSIMQAVSNLMDCGCGDQDTLTCMN